MGGIGTATAACAAMASMPTTTLAVGALAVGTGGLILATAGIGFAFLPLLCFLP